MSDPNSFANDDSWFAVQLPLPALQMVIFQIECTTNRFVRTTCTAGFDLLATLGWFLPVGQHASTSVGLRLSKRNQCRCRATCGRCGRLVSTKATASAHLVGPPRFSRLKSPLRPRHAPHTAIPAPQLDDPQNETSAALERDGHVAVAKRV